MSIKERPYHLPARPEPQKFPETDGASAPPAPVRVPILNVAAKRWNDDHKAYGDGLACECLGHRPQWVGEGVKLIERVTLAEARISKGAHGFIICAQCQINHGLRNPAETDEDRESEETHA